MIFSMKRFQPFIVLIFLFVYSGAVLADCDSIYEWQDFQSFQELKGQVDSLSRKPSEQKALFDTETCLKEEADQLNNWWTTRHFELVENINQTQKTITRVEKQKIEIKQIREEIEIQKQAIQSLRLIYQSKLLEVPTSYLLVAKKRVDVGAVQKEIERQLQDACLRFLQVRYTDHYIKSETKVQNYRVISDFIEDFQGGRAQSFEFDPVVYQDEKEILHYIQVYRLYPLFPIEREKQDNRRLKSSVVTEEQELKKYINQIKTLTDVTILPIIRKQHQIQLNNMLSRVKQINQESLTTLLTINGNYFSKISIEEKNLEQLIANLEVNEEKLNQFPGIEKLEQKLRFYQTGLNAHVSNREIIVVTNPSELSHSGTAVTDQFSVILTQAYKSLVERARESKAYKFYRVENGRLTEADARTYYSKVDPVSYVMPLFRKTHRKAEGVWRIGIVLGLRVNLSHDGSVIPLPVYEDTDLNDPDRTYAWFIVWFILLLAICIIVAAVLITRRPKKKLEKTSGRKPGKVAQTIPPSDGKKKELSEDSTLPFANAIGPFVNSIGIKFVYLPPGAFMMGSPYSEPNRNDEEVLHQVTLSKGFYMGSTEVTVGQWREFIKESGYKTEAEKTGGAIVKLGEKWVKEPGSYWDNPGFPQDENHPVTCVSLKDIQKFVLWLINRERKSYRLPTEAEWEYACRAGTDLPYSFGLSLPTSQANYNGNFPVPGNPKGEYRQRTTPVDNFQPNAWGLYDMHGNVWERCQDRYGDYPQNSITDPEGPSLGSRRVDRGGSWDSHAGFCRSAYRGGSAPDEGSSILGFRIVRQL